MAFKKTNVYEKFGTTGEPDDLDTYNEDFSKSKNTENIDTNASTVDTTNLPNDRNEVNKDMSPLKPEGKPERNYASSDKYSAQTADGRTLSLPLHNSLRNYSSFNYKIGMYALTNDELNNPDESYRVKKPAHAILQSGGGLGDKKVLTAYETGKKKAEYFINALEIETIISPTRKKGSTNAVGFRLEILEPYSMGLFLQALQVSSYMAGHENYLQSPFLLTIDFIGYDDNGKAYTVPEASKNLPFKLVGSDLSVTAGGSSYVVEGVAYNEGALIDETQRIPVDVTLMGRTLEEMLQSNKKSLATELNKHEGKKAIEGKIFTADQYFIVFPKTRASKGTMGTFTEPDNGLSSPNPNAGTSITVSKLPSSREMVETAKLEELYAQISASGPPPPEFEAWIKEIEILLAQASSLGQEIIDKQTGASKSNEIGLSKMFNLESLGTNQQPFGDASFTYDKDKKVWARSNGQLQIDPGLGAIKFIQGTRIQDIIEELVILSDYGRDLIDAPAEKGMRPWFKIDTQVFNVTDKKTEKKTGRPPRIYVFRVMPYMVHESKFIAPDETPYGLSELKKQVCKRYDYIYSGANEDILDLEINLDNTFFKSMSPGILPKNNLADGSKEGEDPKTKTKSTGVNTDTQVNTQTGFVQKNNAKAAGAISLDNMQVEIARRFNDAIVNSDVDLLTLDMKIMGDPYYIADSGVGNYNSENTQYINIDADGAIDYQYGEVDVEVKFRTPIDYRENGIMGFPDETVPVDFFSGLYLVISVKNEFTNGEFTQTLELVRRPQQSPAATAQAGEKGSQTIVSDKTDVTKDTVKPNGNANAGIDGDIEGKPLFEKNADTTIIRISGDGDKNFTGSAFL